MKRTILSGLLIAAFILVVNVAFCTGEEYLYANLLGNSPIYAEHSPENPVDVRLDMEMERLIVNECLDILSSSTLARIERILRKKEPSLKAYYLKLREATFSAPQEKDIRKWYERNMNQFTIPETRDIWFVFVSAYTDGKTRNWDMAKREKARVEELLETYTMEALADELTSPVYYGNNCTKITDVSPDKYTPEVSKIIFSLGRGEQSPFFRTSKGYAAVKISEIHPEKVKPFEEVQAQITPQLVAQSDKYVLDTMMKVTFEKYDITYDWDAWKSKSPAEHRNELQKIATKAGLNTEVAQNIEAKTFKDMVFDLLLVKEYENAPDTIKKAYTPMKEFLKRRHLSLACLDTMAEKKAAVDPGYDELLHFYHEHPGWFYQKGIVKARIATISPEGKHTDPKLARKRAEDLARQFYTRLKQGEDFAALAGEISDDEYATKGGLVGIVDEEKSNMGAIFDINAFELKKGEFTEPLLRPASGSWIIIKVDEVIREKKLLPFELQIDKVRDVSRMFRKNDIAQSLADEYKERARKLVPRNLTDAEPIVLHNIPFSWY
jgi:parvulin-like peptidyl-prolyl isomerase